MSLKPKPPAQGVILILQLKFLLTATNRTTCQLHLFFFVKALSLSPSPPAPLFKIQTAATLRLTHLVFPPRKTFAE